MPNARLLEEQSALKALKTNPLALGGFPRLLKSRTRQVPHQGKAILVRAITSKPKSSVIHRFTSDRLSIEKSLVVIAASLREKTWLDIIDEWLTKPMFIRLARTLVWPGRSDKAMGFMIVLRSCEGDPDDCVALEEAFSGTVKTFKPQFLKSFTFDIYKGEQLQTLEKLIQSQALFTKTELDVRRDMLIVIRAINIGPLHEIEGGEEEEEEGEEEEEEEEEEDGVETDGQNHRRTDDEISLGVLEHMSD